MITVNVAFMFDFRCAHFPCSSLALSYYQFINVSEQAVSPPLGTTEPRLPQIELVNIYPSGHRNVLRSSWAI